MEILTRLDLFDIGRRYVLTRARAIDGSIVDTEGSDANIFVGATAFMAHAVSRQIADRVAALFIDSAEGEELDRLVIDRYQLPRKGAAAALATVRMFRTSVAAGAGTVPVGTVLTSLTGVQYVTLTPASFAALDLDNVTALARSVQAGQQFQVGANQIRRFDNPGVLFDPSLQINNDAPAAGGADAESDTDYRQRAHAFFQAARRGVLGAIEFGALTVPGVESAMAVEVLDPTLARPARVVLLYVADAAGIANAALVASVIAALEEYRAGGIAVIGATTLPQIQGVTLKLTFRAGVDTSTLTTSIRAAVLGFINSLGVGQTLYRSDLNSVLARFRSQGLIPEQSTLVAPTGDIVPDAGRTLRARLEDIVVV